MSHDLRTPLTGVMLYIEILRSHRYSTDKQLEDYLEKIYGKLHNMKMISDNLFKYSLDGMSKKPEESQTMEQALSKAANGFIEDLKANGFRVVSNMLWSPYKIRTNSVYIQRIFENIISNTIKYADSSEEIRIETIDSDDFCGLSVLNAYSFVDENTESNGIGISSISSMMKEMNGICSVEQTDTAFAISLMFPKQH